MLSRGDRGCEQQATLPSQRLRLAAGWDTPLQVLLWTLAGGHPHQHAGHEVLEELRQHLVMFCLLPRKEQLVLNARQTQTDTNSVQSSQAPATQQDILVLALEASSVAWALEEGSPPSLYWPCSVGIVPIMAFVLYPSLPLQANPHGLLLPGLPIARLVVGLAIGSTTLRVVRWEGGSWGCLPGPSVLWPHSHTHSAHSLK